ncbi:class I SAM-dependent methyltransferase [Candidatus Daviesbacteria bacterium]|nr:class I SAM-dependent methyltransferase [Candidatus Daviesbacteria bacterium]
MLKEACAEKLPKHFFPEFREFYGNIFNGELVFLNNTQLKNIVSNFFNTHPLIALTKNQEALLKTDLFQKFSLYYSTDYYGTWPTFAGDCLYLPPGEYAEIVRSYHSFADQPFMITGDKAWEIGSAHGLELMTPSDKFNLFTDPKIWTEMQYIEFSGNGGYTTDHALGNGTRNLCDKSYEGYPDSYGFTKTSFLEILKRIRKSQKKEATDNLKGLDIGGSNGLGAYDAEQLDPNLDVTNITIHPEPGVWPLRGGHMFCLGERLPKDFSEKFDLILSNMAFRYFRYPHIGLKNALYALAPGGVIHISFAFNQSPFYNEQDWPVLEKYILDTFEWFNDLETKGFLKLFTRKYAGKELIYRGKYVLDSELKGKTGPGLVYLQKLHSF